MVQLNLFDINQYVPEGSKEKKLTGHSCKNCINITINDNYSRRFFYCSLHRSRLTTSGQLKVKANQDACDFFERF